MTEEVEKAKARKESLDAMRNAQKHMQDALNRIGSLESALRQSCKDIEGLIALIPPGAYAFNSQQSLRDKYTSALNDVRKYLI